VLKAARAEADANTTHGYGRHLAMDNTRFDFHRFLVAAGQRDVAVPREEVAS
jgi:hypothetical protein